MKAGILFYVGVFAATIALMVPVLLMTKHTGPWSAVVCVEIGVLWGCLVGKMAYDGPRWHKSRKNNKRKHRIKHRARLQAYECLSEEVLDYTFGLADRDGEIRELVRLWKLND
jgi:hypothetical protein